MTDTYEIDEFDQVAPYKSGRRCNDTRAYRDATELELTQKHEIERLEVENEILWDALKFVSESTEAGRWDMDKPRPSHDGATMWARASRALDIIHDLRKDV